MAIADSANFRKVSVPLLIGILIAPYIFAWFLLQEGYSKSARHFAFGWMTLFVGIWVINVLTMPKSYVSVPVPVVAQANDKISPTAPVPSSPTQTPVERSWDTYRDGHLVKCMYSTNNDAIMYIFMPTLEGAQNGEQPVINTNPTIEAFEAMCGKIY